MSGYARGARVSTPGPRGYLPLRLTDVRKRSQNVGMDPVTVRWYRPSDHFAGRRRWSALTISPASRNIDAIRSLHAAGYDVVSSIELTLDLDRHPHEWQEDGLELHDMQFRS